MAQATATGRLGPRAEDGMGSCFRANMNLYLALARQSASGGDVERAYSAYRDCLKSLRRANLLTHGQLREAESAVRRELSDFLLGGERQTGSAGECGRIPLEC